MSDAAATTPPTETTAGTPMMKWKQGTKEGVCAVTNAAGLREALKAAGAIITEAVRPARSGVLAAAAPSAVTSPGCSCAGINAN